MCAAIVCCALMLAAGSVARCSVVAAALRRHLVEEALRVRHVQHADDFAAAAGLAEDHDVARIAAEALDVLVHPLQRRHEGPPFRV